MIRSMTARVARLLGARLALLERAPSENERDVQRFVVTSRQAGTTIARSGPANDAKWDVLKVSSVRARARRAQAAMTAS